MFLLINIEFLKFFYQSTTSIIALEGFKIFMLSHEGGPMSRALLKLWLAAACFSAASSALALSESESEQVKVNEVKIENPSFRLKQFALFQNKNLFQSFQLQAIDEFLSGNPTTPPEKEGTDTAF